MQDELFSDAAPSAPAPKPGRARRNAGVQAASVVPELTALAASGTPAMQARGRRLLARLNAA